MKDLLASENLHLLLFIFEGNFSLCHSVVMSLVLIKRVFDVSGPDILYFSLANL